MSVYVDESVHRLGRMLMCHMMADTHEELVAMAERIGVDQRWLQNVGQPSEHFDVCKAKRAMAVKAGATAVTSRELIAVVRRKREDRT